MPLCETDLRQLRAPDKVMKLSRLGSIHQSRLSFMRILLRRLQNENWQFDRPVFEIDACGVGYAVYSARGPERTYSLVAFSHDLPEEKRSDRVIADAWDATFTLFDGVPSSQDIERLVRNVPLQEAGRISQKELSLSRANRSARLWEHVVDALAKGEQPDIQKIEAVGYLMRTTAVYGSGKFGAADREMIADRPEFQSPFQVEMLSVFLTRAFVRDLVEHVAKMKGGENAVKLNPQIAQRIGIGNSTGLGMAPFLLNHPVLFNNWIAAREQAAARVCAVQHATRSEIKLFSELLERSILSAEHWTTEHRTQAEKIAVFKKDLKCLQQLADSIDETTEYPWSRLCTWSEQELALEGQEFLISLILEPYGALVDDLASTMAADNTPTFRIAGAMPLGDLRTVLEQVYGWALNIDWDAHHNKARAWYVSEEKLEPRLGERFKEPIEEYEQPLAPGRDAAALYRALSHWPSDKNTAQFLLRHPEYRHIVRRVQIVNQASYAEIRDNTIASDVLPIDMLRCKLAFFGAVQFDPRSDRWVRINMYANAPYPEDLSTHFDDFWVYPAFGREI